VVAVHVEAYLPIKLLSSATNLPDRFLPDISAIDVPRKVCKLFGVFQLI
jgi:hypothetical protein